MCAPHACSVTWLSRTALCRRRLRRTLIGEEAFHTPVGQLTPQHLHVARLYLALHSDLLIALEQPRAGCRLSFKWGLGWPAHLQQEKGRAKDSYLPYLKVEDWLPADMEELHRGVGLRGIVPACPPACLQCLHAWQALHTTCSRTLLTPARSRSAPPVPQNHLDDALWRWGGWLVRVEEVTWGVTEASGAAPLPRWLRMGENTTCGYVGHP